MKTKKTILCLIIALITYSSCFANNKHKLRYVDFDANYGIGLTGQKLVHAIQKASEELGKNDILIFNSKSYDFKSINLVLSYPIKISGIRPSQEIIDNATSYTKYKENTYGATQKVEKKGAFFTKTTFLNINKFIFHTDNVTLENLKIVGGPKASYMLDYRIENDGYNNTGQYHIGHRIFNVQIENAKVQVFVGSGAGIDIDHVTFYHFLNTGFGGNRKGQNHIMPKSSVRHCKFMLDLKRKFYNTRGLSMDAGNTEYPIIWNLNNFTIEDNLFVSAGIGFSRCENVIIKNNIRKGYNLSMDAIHTEEFSNHILIDHNTFIHVNPSRGFWVDREGQSTHDITITHNKWIGAIGWVISCYATDNMTFCDNDFTQAYSAIKKIAPFDFNYFQDRKWVKLPYTIPSRNLKFTGNIGLDNMGKMIINLPKKGDNSEIEYPETLLTINRVDLPRAIIKPGKYIIKNKATGQYITALKHSNNIVLSSKIRDAAIWDISYVYPTLYVLQNIKTHKFMSQFEILTLKDIQLKNIKDASPDQMKCKKESRKPNFYFSPYKVGDKEFYIINPGGNEHKSRFIAKNGKIKLAPRYQSIGSKWQTASSDAELWSLEAYNQK